MRQYLVHHDRSHWGIYVTYHCGKTMIRGESNGLDASPAEPAGPLPANMRHCLRCLYGKQKQKGALYMLSQGYPTVTRQRTEYRSWKLVLDPPIPPTSLCCHIGCDAEAEWRLWGYHHRPDDYTEMCTLHRDEVDYRSAEKLSNS